MPSEEKQLYDAITSMGGISVLAAISRSLLSEDRRSFGGFIRDLICAGFVAILVGGFITDYHLAPGMHNLIVGIFAFGAADVLMLLIKAIKMVVANPGAALDWLIEKMISLRGPKE